MVSRPCGVLVWLALVPAVVPAQTPAAHVHAELVSETSALVPGQLTWLGVRLIHEPHWHTYWINPGDSGLPTKLSWTLPAEMHAGAIDWPAPRRFDVGGLYNFGYDGDVLLPVPLDVSSRMRIGTTAPIAVTARWLVCREECIPGEATLALELPVAAGARPDVRSQAAFVAARAARPRLASWRGSARLDDAHIVVTLTGGNLPAADALDVYVIERQAVTYAPPAVAAHAGMLTLTFAKSEYFVAPPPTLDLVLAVRGQPTQAFAVAMPLAEHDSSTTSP